MKVAAHCWTHAGAHNAALAGVASIEHGFNMTDEDLELAKKNNVVLVGTEYLALSIPGTHDKWVDRLRRALEIGTPLVYGTDAIDAPEGSETRGTIAMSGIEPWIEAGVPARVLLKSMTSDAARLLGVEKQRGLLRVGLAADIIATPENPMETPLTLKRVSFVMKDGVVFKKVE
jgi:imidazolonepropionase-like amidohydrolase